ncbi:MAG: hypothetical protein ACRC80_19975, partial [Waterburya sp.]
IQKSLQVLATLPVLAGLAVSTVQAPANAQITMSQNNWGSCERIDRWQNGWAGDCQFPAYSNLRYIKLTGGSGATITWEVQRKTPSKYGETISYSRVGTCELGWRQYSGQAPICWNPKRGEVVRFRVFPHNNRQITHFNAVKE